MNEYTEQTKIALMQERIKNVEINLEKVMTNHLPHIQLELEKNGEEITKLRITVARYGAIVVGAVAIVDIVVKFIPIK